MPQEAAVLERRAARVVLGVIEDGEAKSEIVRPRREVGNSDAKLEGQPPAHLPGILHKALKRVIGDIVDAVEGGLVVRVEITENHVGVHVANRVRVTITEAQLTLRVCAVRLGIADMLPKNSSFERVGTPDLGDSVAGAGHILVRIKTLGLAPDLEAAVGADIRGLR